MHPSRLSFRGFAGSNEAALARNRRVEMHIVKLLDALDPPPIYDSHVRLPWSGGVVGVRQAKERLGLTRKHLIPLLEWLDAQRVTRRVGGARAAFL